MNFNFSTKPTFTSGFTLAELLISLLILSVIATFTIPKVLISQRQVQRNAQAKEVAGMIAGAYQALALNGTVSINTQAQELTPYMNYVSTYSGTVDSVQTGGSVSCAGKLCLKLHGGGVLYTAYNAGTDAFCGTANNNAIAFSYDPEAGYSGSSSEGKTLTIWLGYKGRIQTYADISAGTCYGTPPSCSLSCANPNSTWQPNWFSWN